MIVGFLCGMEKFPSSAAKYSRKYWKGHHTKLFLVR